MVKHWQNIIYKQCPVCDKILDIHRRGFQCPDMMCKFFITREGLIKILTDREHAAIRLLDKDTRRILDVLLKEIGL